MGYNQFREQNTIINMEGSKMGELVVETKSGKVRGDERNGILEFLGIPYAKPPIGDRWIPLYGLRRTMLLKCLPSS